MYLGIVTQDRSPIAQFHEKLSKANLTQTYRCQKLIDCVQRERASEADEKISKIDLISLNKSNKTSSTLNDGMAQQMERDAYNYLITDHHRRTYTQQTPESDEEEEFKSLN